MSTPFQFDGLERNPEACCGNCAYHNNEYDLCMRKPPVTLQQGEQAEYPETDKDRICGDHPNFWRLKQEPKTEADVLRELQNYG